eukprot:CAMPEP_0173322376 /NCGR_PEP_ID=MMETSP1143-20121109/29927_1 /TAXON_ID=483371 /ORGANISM="non described non described, Strain CCMP2298" /LENGTH=102 /DNA_ID=CAMNT_0014266223 /DNA_START=305 /DNA_END=613 /DNA_ORIENTATION=+
MPPLTSSAGSNCAFTSAAWEPCTPATCTLELSGKSCIVGCACQPSEASYTWKVPLHCSGGVMESQATLAHELAWPRSCVGFSIQDFFAMLNSSHMSGLPRFL